MKSGIRSAGPTAYAYLRESFCRKSFLQKYNKRTGWYINWASFENDVEIFALVLKGTVSIEGLIALEPMDEQKAVHIRWACTAPHNDKWATPFPWGLPKHEFRIAIDEEAMSSANGDLRRPVLRS